MTTRARFTIDEVMQALARVEPAPVGMYAYPCARCHYERGSGQPWVALGLYTARGLVEHLAKVHGEAARV